MANSQQKMSWYFYLNLYVMYAKNVVCEKTQKVEKTKKMNKEKHHNQNHIKNCTYLTWQSSKICHVNKGQINSKYLPCH